MFKKKNKNADKFLKNMAYNFQQEMKRDSEDKTIHKLISDRKIHSDL